MEKGDCKPKKQSNDVISYQEGNVDTIIEDCSNSLYSFVSYLSVEVIILLIKLFFIHIIILNIAKDINFVY